MTETDYTLYNIKIFDIVDYPGFGSATITNSIGFITRKNIRKRKIKNLFNLSDTITK